MCVLTSKRVDWYQQAGVTFLALGNGAPDIFSVYAGVVNTKGTAGGSLAIGELFGAGVFVTTVVFGAVSFVAPFTLTRRPFLRDCVCYFVATVYLFVIMLRGEITISQSIGFLGIYVVYVCVVVFGRKIYQARKKRLAREKADAMAAGDPDVKPLLQSSYDTRRESEDNFVELEQIAQHIRDDHYKGTHHSSHHHPTSATVAISHAPRGTYGKADLEAVRAKMDISAENAPRANIYEDDIDDELEVNVKDENVRVLPVSIWGELAEEFFPFEDTFATDKWYWKIYAIVRAPIYMLLVLTVPIVDFEDDRNRWSKPLNTLHCLTAPLAFAFAAQLSRVAVSGNLVVWELMIILGFVTGPIVWFTTRRTMAPRWQPVYAYIGFAVAIMWISAFANEIVNILETIGRIIGISDAILGLTVLAWGNSIGDLVADVTVARQGFPRMGVGAAIGGPAMNMLLGIGISCTIKCGKIGGPYPIAAPSSLIVSGSFLMLSLLSSMTIVPYNKFAVGKKYGMYLFAVYVCMFSASLYTSLR